MSLTIDMEKAFDNLEIPYLEALLAKMNIREYA